MQLVCLICLETHSLYHVLKHHDNILIYCTTHQKQALGVVRCECVVRR